MAIQEGTTAGTKYLGVVLGDWQCATAMRRCNNLAPYHSQMASYVCLQTVVGTGTAVKWQAAAKWQTAAQGFHLVSASHTMH